MKAALFVFLFALVVTSWLTESGPPQGSAIGITNVGETPSGTDVDGNKAYGDFFVTGKDRELKIQTSIRGSGDRVGDAPRLGIE